MSRRLSAGRAAGQAPAAGAPRHVRAVERARGVSSACQIGVPGPARDVRAAHSGLGVPGRSVAAGMPVQGCRGAAARDAGSGRVVH